LFTPHFAPLGDFGQGILDLNFFRRLRAISLLCVAAAGLLKIFPIRSPSMVRYIKALFFAEIVTTTVIQLLDPTGHFGQHPGPYEYQNAGQ
jgi:hypothetical protein